MAYNEASKRATLKYRKEHLKSLTMCFPKEEYEDLKEYADKHNKGVATVIREAVKKEISGGTIDN